MKKIALLISLFSLGTAFAAPTCQKYSNSAWGVEKLNQQELEKVTAKYRGLDCGTYTKEEAIQLAATMYNRMPCQPQGNVDFGKLLTISGDYTICTGVYNYYNWFEETIRVISSDDNPDFNLAFASAWEE